MSLPGDSTITSDEQQSVDTERQPDEVVSGAANASTPANPTFFSTVWSIVWKDLTIERHTRQLLSVMLFFSLTTVVVYNFALYGDLAAAREVATGLLWITILLAGTLGLNRSLMSEQENRSLEAILMAPIDRSAIYLGKVISVLTFTLLVEAILVPIFIAFFNKPFWRPQVLLILFLGTIGYVAAGVLVTSMTVQTRTREVLLPVLLLPLTLPAVLAAAQITAAFTAPVLPEWSEVQFAFALVVAYDILMITAGFLTYQYVVEE
ncbi:MAG TPA: heme exporter protein CcmB [Anaerolineae bacterium]|jgi:heme exporter protein B|nr:heme exporter protein CcmB [Anaerolineae bacterium]